MQARVHTAGIAEKQTCLHVIVVVFVTHFCRIMVILVWWRHIILFLTNVILVLAASTSVKRTRSEHGHASQRTTREWVRSRLHDEHWAAP